MEQLLRQRVPEIIDKRGLGIDVSQADRLTDIFVAAFGHDFFARQRQYKDTVSGQMKWEHPLVDALLKNEVAETGVVEMLELARYLETFSSDGAIAIVLDSLRAPRQYKNALFQLAMGFRLSRFCDSVSLEPKTSRGFADICFSFREQVCMAECYHLKVTFLDVMGRVEKGLADYLFGLVPSGRKYSFFITLGELLTPSRLSALKHECQKITDTLKDNARCRRLEMVVGNHRVDVHDITDLKEDPDFPKGATRPRRLDDANASYFQSHIPADNIFEAMTVAPPAEHQSRVFYRREYEHQWPNGPISTLWKKLSRKMSQTRTDDETITRGLFVEMPSFGARVDTPEPKGIPNSHLKLQEYAVRTFDRFGFLLIATRSITQDRRFMYEGNLLIGKKEHAVPDEFIELFNQAELQNPLLK